MPDETDLPPDLALLWGVRETPRRGPKPALTVQDITRAAIEVADAEGLEAVSMAKVAAQLGNATMALYRHVKSKRELLLLMSDAALEPPPALPAGDWRVQLTYWAQQVRVAVGRHVWYAKIPISGPPLGPRNLQWFDSALSTLSDTALTEPEKIGLVMGLMTYVRGGYVLSAELAAGYAEDPTAFGRQYHNVLTRMVDPEQYPALSKLVASGVFDEDSSSDDFDADFDFGLEIYLDGIAAYLARRQS